MTPCPCPNGENDPSCCRYKERAMKQSAEERAALPPMEVKIRANYPANRSGRRAYERDLKRRGGTDG